MKLHMHVENVAYPEIVGCRRGVVGPLFISRPGSCERVVGHSGGGARRQVVLGFVST